MPRILAMAGSARKASFNKKLVAEAAERARDAGAEVTLVDLRDYPMPLYDGDLEAESGIPEQAKALRSLMLEHHGLLLACPEYNGSITPLLKNTIDWVSRPDDDLPPTAAFAGKTATLLATSPGALGGLRGLVHVRSILGGIGVLVLPKQVAVGKAFQVFGGDEPDFDDRTRASLDKAVQALVDATRKLHD